MDEHHYRRQCIVRPSWWNRAAAPLACLSAWPESSIGVGRMSLLPMPLFEVLVSSTSDVTKVETAVARNMDSRHYRRQCTLRPSWCTTAAAPLACLSAWPESSIGVGRSVVSASLHMSRGDLPGVPRLLLRWHAFRHDLKAVWGKDLFVMPHCVGAIFSCTFPSALRHPSLHGPGRKGYPTCANISRDNPVGFPRLQPRWHVFALTARKS